MVQWLTTYTGFVEDIAKLLTTSGKYNSRELTSYSCFDEYLHKCAHTHTYT